MENILQPWFDEVFLQNNNHQAVKMESILEIEHSPYYIALGSTPTHKLTLW